MCTATWWQPADGGLRFYFNRDERRSRGPASPPGYRRAEGVRYVAPRDSDAGGTWIAANECGLVVALLNGYVEESRGEQPPAPQAGWISRGHLVDALAASVDLPSLLGRVEALDLHRFRSFVLLSFAPGQLGRRCAWLDGTLRIEALEATAMPISSSSFDTVRVLDCRRRRWAAFREGSETTRHDRHLAFQASTDPAGGAYSVCMSRPDAATRSFCWVDVVDGAVRMHYRDAPPCDVEEPETVIQLPRRAVDSTARAVGGFDATASVTTDSEP